MIRIKQVLTIISFLSISFIYGQVNVFTSGFTANILQDYEFVFGAGNVNMTAGNINTANITGFDVVIVNSIDQGYVAGVIPKLVNYVNNGGHVILSTEGGMAGGNRLMSTVWNNLTGDNITETPSWAAGTGSPPRYHNSNGPWSSSPDAQVTGATGSYASFGNMNAMNVIHQRLLSPPTCDNIEALSAAYPSRPNLGDGTLYIQGEVQYPFMNFSNSVPTQTHARALVRMHFALLNNDQVLLDDLNTWNPNLAVDTNFLSVRDTAFCDANFTPFNVTAPSLYDTYSWEDLTGNVLGTNSSFNVSQSGIYVVRTTGTPPACDGIDTLIVEVDSLIFTSTSVASCLNTQEGELIVDNVSANYLAHPITYSLNNIIQPSDSLFTNLSPGNYNLVVQDSRGCVDSAIVTINGLEVPSPNFTFDTVCLGASTSFTDLSTITTGNISSWEWIIDNTSDINQNTSYTLNSLSNSAQLKVVSDAGCTDSILQSVIVNPLPEATIAGDAEVCQDAPEPQIIFTGSSSTAPYTFTYTINGGAQQTVTSTGNTAMVNVPTNTAGTYSYELVSVEDASATTCNQLQTGIATVTVNPLPEATIAGDTELCQDAPAPQIIFTGSNSAAPYTFTYTINGGAPQAVTSTGNTATVNVPTNAAGTYTYELVSIEDASATTCSQLQTGTATITVNPLPEAIIAGDAEVCQDAPEPQIIFTGSNSTAPYTFTYTINGGAQQTVISTGNTATVNVPTNTTGTYNYELVSVEDASATTCGQLQTGTATVIVNPLPEATIAGDAEVCQDALEPQITFTGSSSTAPYIFTYTINGGGPQTATSTGNTATVNVPTTTAGTYTYELVSVEDASATTCNQLQTGTATVIVNPLPEATIAGDTEVCQDAPVPQITFTGSNSIAPYTFTYTINVGAPQTVTSTGNTATVNVSTATAGTYTYELVSVEDASATSCSQLQNGTATITVNTLPEATISGDIEVCLNSQETPYVTFVGSNGIAPYTFTYSINGQAPQTITSNNGGAGTVAVPTNQAGSFEYELLSVQDSSVPGCSQTQTGVVTVVVHDLPTATITGSDSVCQNEEYPEIEFTGTSGSPSYTFSYSLNGESQTVSSGGNDNAFITVPTDNAGTFVYNLDQVEESGLGCVQTLSESITVVVHPLPIPSFDPTPSSIVMSENTSQMENSSIGAENYIWTFPDGSISNLESPYSSFNIEYVGQEFVILLEAISEYGCRDYTERVVVVEEDLIIYVPNTFTPDGDGSNDVFTPVITEGVDPSDYSFRIYNRWGELIFETSEVNRGWDGHYKGLIAKDGTYVWQMEFRKSTDDERIIKTGSLNLLR